MWKTKKLVLYTIFIIVLSVAGVLVTYNCFENGDAKRGALSPSAPSLSYTCVKYVNQMRSLKNHLLELYSNAGNNSVNSEPAVRYDNPIDKYYIPKIKSDISNAGITGLERCYYFVWKEEYENIIKWIEEKCKTETDIKTARNLDEHIQACIDEVETLATRINDPSGIYGYAYVMYVKGKLYREYSHYLISVYAGEDPYVYMDRDYSEIVIP